MERDKFRGALLLYTAESIDELVDGLADDMWARIDIRLWFERWADERESS